MLFNLQDNAERNGFIITLETAKNLNTKSFPLKRKMQNVVPRSNLYCPIKVIFK